MSISKTVVHIPKENEDDQELMASIDQDFCEIEAFSGEGELLKLDYDATNVLVLKPFFTNWKWLNMLFSLKDEHPEVPVILFSTLVDIKQEDVAALEKRSIFVADSPAALNQQLSRYRAEGAGKRILIVDDDQSILNSYQRILRKTPWEIVFVNSGEQALELMEERQFDLVVTDIKMPGIHGVELVGRIREHDSRVSVIVCSAFGGMKEDQNLMIHDVRDFIEKPVDPVKFKEKLEEVMNRS